MTASRILKSTALNLAGKKRLNAAPAVSAEPAGTTGSAQAKILSQSDGQVVIQVICPCGQEIQLRCASDASA